MKKILFAVLASTFATALMADYVYDYKASIKRIDPSYKVRTFTENQSKVKGVTESYNVVSDTLSGYIVVPRCIGCDEDGIVTSLNNKNGKAYIVRKGNKYAKYTAEYDENNEYVKDVSEKVLVTPVVMSSGIFGAYVYNAAKDGKPRADIKDAKKAWMSLDYASQNNESTKIPFTAILKNVGETPQWYGFLGVDNLGVVNVYSTGFGTVAQLSQKDKYEFGVCDDNVIDGYSCQYINTISGSLIGYANYMGACDITPMWDLCYSARKENSMMPINEAVITGTWTLKFNKSLTKITDAAEQQAAILSKLKATEDDIVEGEELGQ